MRPVIFKEALKIWDKISIGEKLSEVKLELEVHKKLLNIFLVGNFYYLIFNLKESLFDLCVQLQNLHLPTTVLSLQPQDTFTNGSFDNMEGG